MKNKKKNISKKHLAIVITAASLLLLITAYIVINALIPLFRSSSSNSGTSAPEVLAGEAVIGTMAAIYPYIEPSSILAVQIDKFFEDEESGQTKKDSYMMSKPKDDEGKRTDYFVFSYADPDTGEKKVYYPDILYEDANFDYTDLYAVEQSNGLGVRKIDYLCAAIGALYFDERIPLSSAAEEKKAQLNRYGLSEEDRETVFITYLDENGNEKIHTLFVGNKLITGVGYYFMLQGRDYVYTSSQSNTLSYALGGFEQFIDARIIAEEVSGDKGAAPYHTNEYSQWTSKYYTITDPSQILTVPAGVDAVINAKYIQPIYAVPSGDTSSTPGFGTGYRYSSYDKLSVNGEGTLKGLLSALIGKNVGKLDKNLVYTLVTDMNSATLFDSEKNTGIYEYTVYAIEAVVTESGDISNTGAVIPEGAMIKVEYSFTVDGKRVSTENSHALIDLSADSAIDSETIASLQASKVGTLPSPMIFEVKYDESNSNLHQISYVISEISLILDKNGNPATKITEDSIVNFDYYYLLDGKRVGESGKRTLILSEVAEDGADGELKKLLIGKTRDDRMLKINTEEYCQALMDFTAYEISDIEGYIALEKTVSFGFVPEALRDPFHAESIYKNLLPSDNKYSAYAMNNESCDAVLRILGGIGTSSTSSSASGLVGSETVAVGLSFDTLSKYKLFDGYRIYFELPRGLASGGSEYSWLDRIGFTLYIGTEILPDGKIYVASNLYDTVVKIDPSVFDYLKFSFPEYWARRNLALIDVFDIESLYVDINYEDLYGEYSFDFNHIQKETEGDSEEGTMLIDVIVNALSDRRTESLFSSVIDSSSLTSCGLASIYNIAGGSAPDSNLTVGEDSLGTDNMKELLRMMYSTFFLGILDEETQAKASEENRILTFEFDLGVNSDHTYRYDFYRVEDRRIMVSLYRVNSSGEPMEAVSDLYISDFALKKIVSGFESLLNGEIIDPDKAYGN